MKLLCRFYDPDRGRILWDGVDLRDMDPGRAPGPDQRGVPGLHDLRAQRGREHRRRRPRAGRASRAAGGRRPAGRHPRHRSPRCRRATTPCSPGPSSTWPTRRTRETGVLLSGGQWQRLALARAFLRGDRDLMILDEPSSGLDAEAEHEIHRSLRAQRRGHDHAADLAPAERGPRGRPHRRARRRRGHRAGRPRRADGPPGHLRAAVLAAGEGASPADGARACHERCRTRKGHERWVNSRLPC